MGELKKQRIAFAANDKDSPRHELALERFGSVLDLNRAGDLMLAEMKHVSTGELHYIMMAYWTDPDTTDQRVVPFSRLFVDFEKDNLYAFPDGEGGYHGMKEGHGDGTEATPTDDPIST